jgi:hypothetical protein
MNHNFIINLSQIHLEPQNFPPRPTPLGIIIFKPKTKRSNSHHKKPRTMATQASIAGNERKIRRLASSGSEQ